jgi:hypothetical protein
MAWLGANLSRLVVTSVALLETSHNLIVRNVGPSNKSRTGFVATFFDVPAIIACRFLLQNCSIMKHPEAGR